MIWLAILPGAVAVLLALLWLLRKVDAKRYPAPPRPAPPVKREPYRPGAGAPAVPVSAEARPPLVWIEGSRNHVLMDGNDVVGILPKSRPASLVEVTPERVPLTVGMDGLVLPVARCSTGYSPSVRSYMRQGRMVTAIGNDGSAVPVGEYIGTVDALTRDDDSGSSDSDMDNSGGGSGVDT